MRLFVFILISFKVLSCEINLSYDYLIEQDHLNINHLTKIASNCSFGQLKKLYDIIPNVDQMPIDYISKIIPKAKIKCKNTKIRFWPLKQYILSKLGNDPHIKITWEKGHFPITPMDSFDNIKVNYHHKNDPGGLNRIQIQVIKDSKPQIITFYYKVEKEIFGYTYLENLNYKDKIDPKKLIKVSIFSSNTNITYPKLEEYKFMTARNFIKKGTIISFNHLIKEKLIKRGDIIKINASLKNSKLEINAKATQDGVFGEEINLINPKTKKIIQAQVSGRKEASLL